MLMKQDSFTKPDPFAAGPDTSWDIRRWDLRTPRVGHPYDPKRYGLLRAAGAHVVRGVAWARVHPGGNDEGIRYQLA